MARTFYDDALEAADQAPEAPAADQANPFLDTLRKDDETQRTRMRGAAMQAIETTPDRAADVRRISARTGIAPEIVERDFDTYTKRATVDAVPYPTIQKETPKLAGWLEQPQNAKLASDDLEALSNLARTTQHTNATERLLNIGRFLESGLTEGMAGIFGALGAGAKTNAGLLEQLRVQPIIKNEVVTTFHEGMRKALVEIAKEKRPDKSGMGMLESGIYSGIESIGMMLPGFVASTITKSPAPMLTAMGLSTFGSTYGTAVDQGIGHQQATASGLFDAAVEVATEFLPAKWFFADVAKNPGLLQIIKHQLGGEVPGELIATTLQSLNEFVTLRGDDDPIGKWAEQLPGALAETIIATVTMVGVMGAAGGVMSKFKGDQGRATQAENDQAFLKDLSSAVKSSTTAKRSPEAMQGLVTDLTAGGEVEHLYAPADTFATYWQDKGLDTPQGRVEGPEAVADFLTGRPGALKEAITSGVDLEIPTATYAAQIAGTDHHTFFADELRVGSATRMNARELTAFREAEIAKAAEPVVGEPVSPASPVRERILQGIRAAVAGTKVTLPAGAEEGYADLFEALGSMATRQGLDPLEHLQRYGLVIAGPQESAAPARVSYATKIAEITAKREAHVSQVEGIFAAEGGVRLKDSTGRESIIHPSQEEPGKVQLTTYSPLGIPTSNLVFDDVASAANYVQGFEAVPPAISPVVAPAAPTPVEAAAADAVAATEPVDPATQEARNAALRAESAGAGPAYLDPVAIAAGRALAARLAANKAVDVGPEGVDTEGATDATPQPLPSRRTDRAGRPAGHRVSARHAGTGRKAQAKAEAHFAAVFDATLAAARELDPTVDPAQLRAEFDFRLELLLERAQIAVDTGSNHHDLLRAIAKLGGLYEPDDGKGMHGELVALGYGARFGMLSGVPGVFAARKRITKAGQGTARGFGFDVMLQKLQSDPRWSWLESIDMLVDQLDTLSRTTESTPTSLQLPGTEELRDVHIRQELPWWADALVPVNEDAGIDENPDDTGLAEGDFDVSTFDQTGQLKTDTPAFQRWFLESQVVDAAGQPLVVYHSGDFNAADDAIPRTDNGMHFGTKRAAEDRPHGKLVDDFILAADLGQDDEGGWWWDSSGWESHPDGDEPGFETREEAVADLHDKAIEYADSVIQDMDEPALTAVYLSIQNPKRLADQKESWTRAIATAKAEGHDGIVYRNEFEDKGQDSWIVFSPQQVKSATANVGTFDPEALSILFQDEATPPTATYAGEQEDGLGGTRSIYTLRGPAGEQTVTAETLLALGLPVPPKTDVLDTGERQARLFDEPGGGGRAAELGELPFSLTAEIVPTPAVKRLQRTLFQGLIESTDAGPQPTFYSRIVRAVQAIQQTQDTGRQWVGMIRNSKIGVNLDEFALTGIEDLEPDTVYTKQEVLDYLSVHTAEVSEVILGEAGEDATSVADERNEWVEARAQETYDAEIDQLVQDAETDYKQVRVKVFEYAEDDGEIEAGTWGYSLDGEDQSESFESEDDAQRAADEAEERENDRRDENFRDRVGDNARDQVSWREHERAAEREWESDHEDDRGESDVQYGDPEYRLDPTPGYEPESYREAFVTAEGRQFLRGNAAAQEAAVALAEQRAVLSNQVMTMARRIDDLRFDLGSGFLTAEATQKLQAELDDLLETQLPARRDERDEIGRRLQVAQDAYQVTSWSDGHDHYENVNKPIVRVRFNTRYGTATNGERLRLMFVEEVQPPREEEQPKVPAIYLKNWREIGLKWALRYAAEHGYGGLAWTTGEQQRERWSLRRQVDSISWLTRVRPTPLVPLREIRIRVAGGGTIDVAVNTLSGIIVSGQDRAENWAHKHLRSAIGKDLADRILHGDDAGELKEAGLEVGGVGLKRLYDEDFVSIVKKLPAVKTGGSTMTSFDIGLPQKQYVLRQYPVTVPDTRITLAHEREGFLGRFETQAEADAYIAAYGDAAHISVVPERAQTPFRVSYWEVNQSAEVVVGEYETRAEAEAAINDPAMLAARLAAGPMIDLGIRGGDPVPPRVRTAVKYRVVQYKDGLPVSTDYSSKEEAEQFMQTLVTQGAERQPGVAITPATRAAVLGGQTLFQSKPPAPPTGFAALAKYMSAEEQKPLKSHTRQRLIDVFRSLPPDRDFKEAALAGLAKRGWYRDAVMALRQVFGPVDAPRFAMLLAAMSPRTNVETNLLNTAAVWIAWDNAGRPQTRKAIVKILASSVQGEKGDASVLNSWINNSVSALTTDVPGASFLSGPKVHSFYRNLLGEMEEVTSDAWMASFSFVDQVLFKGKLNATGDNPGKVPGYLAMSIKIRRVAEQLTKETGEVWTPAEVQETIWSWAKTLYELAKSEKTTAEEIVREGRLTDAHILAAPDFKSLLTANAPVRDILEAGGYGKQLKALEAKLARPADRRSGRARGALASTPGEAGEVTLGVLRSARRLDAVRAARKAAGEDDDTLDQGDAPVGKRGSITGPFDQNAFFGPELQFTIKLFEGADASTFLHEGAHLFLKMMQDLAARPEATAGIKADLATIRQRFGPDGVEQHERFARAFEQYLAEGKAPSLQLRALFQNFRAWLLQIYKSLSALDVELTDDVRGVFDRMLASDAAIAEAQAAVSATPMFTTAESARMSPSEFDVYRAQVQAAGLAAREKLEAQLLRDVKKQQRAAYQAEKQRIREQVQAEVYAMPVYRAIAAMGKGTNPDGSPLVDEEPPTPLRLSRQIIVDRYDAATLAKLPAEPTLVTDDGGLDPEAAADLFGFDSGGALLAAVADAKPMRGVIETETKKRMTAQAGDLIVDDQLPALARAAIANEHRAEIIQIEMATLNRLRRAALAGATKEREYERRWFEAETKLRIAIAEGRKQTQIDALDAEVKTLKALARGGAARINAHLPSREQLRDVARARIERTRVSELKPERFWAAARRAGQAALEAAARQDIPAAMSAKQQEAISLALYAEAMRAQEAIQSQVKAAAALGTVAARKRLGLAGAGYLEQVDALLDRYDFAPRSGPALAKRQSLRDWLQELEAEGIAPDLPESMIDDARRVNFKELTVAELADVSAALTAIVHLARLKNKLLKNKDARDFAVVRDGLVASILEHGRERDLPVAFRKADELWRSVREWFASHARISTLAQVMDGAGDGGAMHSVIVRPLNDALGAQELRYAAEGRAYAAILEAHYPGRQLGRLHELLPIPAIGTSLTLDERLGVARNWGNATSRDRMLSDPQRKWNQKQIQAILDTLDANDLAFVQATFDFVNRFWPEIAAKTKRLTGLEPEKVEAVEIVAKAGTIPGGYYPLVADSRFNARTKQWEKVNEAKLKTSAAYVSQTTKRGHLETRKRHAEYTVKLDSGVIFGHIEQVVHDLTHHETLIDVTRLLRDPQVADAIFRTQGDVVYDQFTGALEAIAAGKLAPAENMMDQAATFMRERTQIALLGYNLWTAVQQPLGLFNGMERVGVRWVARGLRRWLSDAVQMENTVGWIQSVSPLMKGRHNTATTDLHDVRGALQTAGGWFDTLVRTVTADHLTQQNILDSFLWHIGLMQRVADVPTWLGQYEKSMAAGEPEDRAISQADQAVVDSQGSGRISDLSSIQRGRPVARMFLMFYSYGSATYNATYRRAGQTNFKSPLQVTSFLGGLSLIYIFPSVATVALSQLLRGGGDDDDEWLTKYLSDVGRESVGSALNGMVLVRELGTAAADLAVAASGGEPREGGVRGYSGPAGTRMLQIVTQLFKEAEQGVPDEGLWKALNATMGIVFRYPAAQVQRSIDGWRALEADKTDNPAALLMGPPRKR